MATKKISKKPSKDTRSQQSDAAKARWEGVSKSERKSLASKASHERWKNKGIVIAESSGTVNLAGLELSCAVLENGTRVISERSVNYALSRQRSPNDYAAKKATKEAGAIALPTYVADERISQFLSDEAKKKLANPIRYQLTKGFGIPAVGLDATSLGDVCDAYIQAQQAGVLRPEEQAMANSALTLIRALAKVAIVALIDEATGHQVKRSRDELQQLLAQYVSEEHRPWSKIFPDEFYIELFRLRDLKMDDVRKRPSYFGYLTNDIVYKRLIPGLLPRLNNLNPVEDGKRKRKRKHTQYLTDSVGEHHLRSHLAGVVMLMKAADTYDAFKLALDRAAPEQVVNTEAVTLDSDD